MGAIEIEGESEGDPEGESEGVSEGLVETVGTVEGMLEDVGSAEVLDAVEAEGDCSGEGAAVLGAVEGNSVGVIVKSIEIEEMEKYGVFVGPAEGSDEG